MCHSRSGGKARECRRLGTVLHLRYTHEFCAIYTLYALVFTYCTWLYPCSSSVDSKTYFRLFVEPATSASKARSMRKKTFQSCAPSGSQPWLRVALGKPYKTKLAHRGINQAYCRVYHPAMTPNLGFITTWRVTRTTDNGRFLKRKSQIRPY